MLNLADFDEAYANKPNNVEEIPCQAPSLLCGFLPSSGQAR